MKEFLKLHQNLDLVIGVILLAIGFVCGIRRDSDPNWVYSNFIFQDNSTPMWSLLQFFCWAVAIIFLLFGF